MKKLLTHCLLILALLSPLNLHANEITVETYKQCLQTSVLITNLNERGINTGSGTIVRSKKQNGIYMNLILSCSHIFPTASQKTIITRGLYKDDDVFIGFEKYTGCVLYKNEKTDISVLEFASEKEMPVCPIDWSFKEKIGMELVLSGCGKGKPPKLVNGSVSYLEEPRDIVDVQSYVIPGSSGGGVFYKNKLVGIIRSIDQYQNIPITASGQYVKIKMFEIDAKAFKQLDFILDTTTSDIPTLPSIIEEIKDLKILEIKD